MVGPTGPQVTKLSVYIYTELHVATNSLYGYAYWPYDLHPESPGGDSQEVKDPSHLLWWRCFYYPHNRRSSDRKSWDLNAGILVLLPAPRFARMCSFSLYNFEHNLLEDSNSKASTKLLSESQEWEIIKQTFSIMNVTQTQLTGFPYIYMCHPCVGISKNR